MAGHVLEIGGTRANLTRDYAVEEIQETSEASPVRCLDGVAAEEMMQKIDDAKKMATQLAELSKLLLAACQLDLVVTYNGTKIRCENCSCDCQY